MQTHPCLSHHSCGHHELRSFDILRSHIYLSTRAGIKARGTETQITQNSSRIINVPIVIAPNESSCTTVASTVGDKKVGWDYNHMYT